MLTRKQHELLIFIDRRLREDGVSPSFEEMKDALGLKSKSGIHRLISGLEERGFIRRLAHRARALEVMRLPDGTGYKTLTVVPDVQPPPPAAVYTPSVLKSVVKAPVVDLPKEVAGETIQLPLYGRIAAGTPIEALRDSSMTVGVPAAMLTSLADHYALEVAGDSMIEAGVLDGDTVIIQRCENAETGAIVVALVDDAEVTLKRLRRKDQAIGLEPANAAYETRFFGPDRVKVQGRLVGLIRRY